MTPTLARIEALAAQSSRLAPWLGEFDRELLLEWLRLELGDAGALDGWISRGGIRARAVPLSPVLHIVSGNTPHAGFQSVARGLLVGCQNRVKVPSAGLPELEDWLADLPGELAKLVTVRRDLPEDWLQCEAAVIFGDWRTLATFRGRIPATARRIEHGPKLSIAVIFRPDPEVAARVAEDILRHDQRGCLSVQAVFVDGSEQEIHAFGDALADELAGFRLRHGRPSPTLSDSGAVSNAREIARFRAANGDGLALWESEGSTDWTIVYDPDTTLAPGPLNGFVRLHPLPTSIGPEVLGDEAGYVSTVAIHPFSEEYARRLEAWGPPRICEAGRAQDPTIFWHHDGYQPLANLVRWKNLG